MIITCAQCATQFQLDEARVPESGIRVRCSVCKHAFFVAHPDAVDEAAFDPVDRVVRSVLDSEPGAVPETTRDLETPETAPGPGGGPDEGAEESWEFDDGGRLSDPAASEPSDRFEESFEAAREAVDDLLGGPWKTPEPEPSFSRQVDDEAPPEPPEPADDIEVVVEHDEPPPEPAESPDGIEVAVEEDEGSGLALADDPWDSPAWSEPAEARAPATAGPVAAPVPPQSFSDDPPAAPISVDAFSDDPLAPPDALPAFDRELPEEEPFPAFDAESAERDELAFDDAAGAFEEPATGDASEAIGTADASELDRFEAELSNVDGASDLATPESWGLEAPPEREPLGVASIPAPARAEATATAPIPLGFGAPFERDGERGSVVAWIARAGSGLGWGAVAILAAVALWGSVAPRATSAPASGAQPLAGLEATGVAGRWVENATLGPLYVVSGELHNPGSETRAAGARLVVRLLDAQGQPVDESAASLGPPLGMLALREARAEDLRKRGEAAALELSRTRVAPGARVPFEAVVLDLPDAAQRFDLVAAGR